MSLDTPEEWEAAIVEVLKDYGRPLKEDELIKMVAKICKVSPVRIRYALGLAEFEGLVTTDEKTNKVSLS